MKILFITSRFPYPPHGGDKLRVFNLIKLLAQKHEIYLISFIESEKEEEYIEELKKFCKEINTILLSKIKSYLNCIFCFFCKEPLQISYYRSNRMHSKIKEYIEKYRIDSIYIHLIRMAPYAKDLKLFKVLDLTDVISLSLRRSLRYRRHIFYLFYLLEWLKVKRYEKKIIQQFDKCLLISEKERNAIKSAEDLAKIEIVPNGVDLEELLPLNSPLNDKKIAFVGNLHTFANRDAVLFFYKDIFPLIKKEIPEIKFYIIGINPPSKIMRLKYDKSIVVTGPVDDLRYYLKDSACFVCPLRSGTGIQNKILEALSLGLPVITTSIGFEGLKVKKGEDLLVTDDPTEFAKNVIKVLKNEELREKLSKNARISIEKEYSWQKIMNKLENIFGEKQTS